MTTLSDKVVLITGGGSGVGLATAKLFVTAGSKVVITGRSREKLEAAGSLGSPEKVLAHATDVSDLAQVESLVKRVNDHFGAIDVLVNNAGTNLKERTMKELTPEAWDRLIRTNLDGAFYCTYAVLPGMRERSEGVIVNVNSVAGKRASPLAGAAYAASKHGMHGLGICLAAEEKESNIRVSNIYPGEIDTAILDVRPTAVTEDHRAKILKPEDVAQAVFFVAQLPAHVSVPELVIKPTSQSYI